VSKFSGKTALGTGALRGIGRAMALAEEGAQLLVHYNSGAKETDAAMAESVRQAARLKDQH
jgi:Dehydrogenases with different specificities (related to short-chain alcohol dehydrogenases)